MKARLDGFTTRTGLHWLIDRLWNEMPDDVVIMTGVNLYFTPRSKSGSEIHLVDENREVIESLSFSLDIATEVPLRRPKSKKPKLSVVGGKQ